MKYLLFMIAATFSFSSVSAWHKIFKPYTHIIRKADAVFIYNIDSLPTDPKLQDATKKYIGQYLVSATKNVDTSRFSYLQKAVLNKASYLHDATKRCPFMGKYAIGFVKGQKKIILIISPAGCSKVMVYLPNQSVPYNYDLAENNAIEAYLK